MLSNNFISLMKLGISNVERLNVYVNGSKHPTPPPSINSLIYNHLHVIYSQYCNINY